MSQEKPFELPAPGDIVYCRFPERLGRVGPKPRPAFVLAQIVFEDGVKGVTVAYGTSKKTDLLYSGEFLVSRANPAAFELAGLSFDTRFDLGKPRDLPYTDKWFQVPQNPRYGQTPKRGTLHSTLTLAARAAFVAAQAKKPE